MITNTIKRFFAFNQQLAYTNKGMPIFKISALAFHKNYLLLLYIFIGLVFVSCSKDIAGKTGVDETSNGITAFVTDTSGLPTPDAIVVVRPSHFRSSGILQNTNPKIGHYTLLTDTQGRFVIDSLPSGVYTLEIYSHGNGSLLSIHVDSLGKINYTWADTIIVQKMGSITGQIQLPPGTPFAQILVPGTERLVYTDSQGNFTINEIPAGEIQILALAPDSIIVLASNSITVKSGENTDAGTIEPPVTSLSDWSHTMTVTLNTKSSGVPIPKRLIQYPLLVRLNDAYFPSEASLQGADLRVFDPIGNIIPYTITHWDPLNRKANLWIKLPRIEVNDSTIVAHIKWGRAGTISAQNSSAVFDTANGHVAAFALDSRYINSDGQLVTKDASANQLTGHIITTGTLPIFSEMGAHFDSTSQGIAVANFPFNFGGEAYTIEAWLKPEVAGSIWLSRLNRSDSIWNHGERIYYLGESGKSATINTGLQPAILSHADSVNQYIFAKDSITLNQWTHLAIRRNWINAQKDTAKIEMFVNGSMVPMVNQNTLEQLDKLQDSLYIAGSMFGRSYQGSIANLMVSKGLRSAEWIWFSSKVQQLNTKAIKLHVSQITLSN